MGYDDYTWMVTLKVMMIKFNNTMIKYGMQKINKNKNKNRINTTRKVEQKVIYKSCSFRKVKLNCGCLNPLTWLQKLRCKGALCPWDHEIF